MALTSSELVLRAARPEDGTTCGQICYDAFAKISQEHGFGCELPGPEAAISALSEAISDPGSHCILAECERRIVGSICMDERSTITGLGPVSVDPSSQNLGVGRRLMRAAMDRANQKAAIGIRLLQSTYHNRSLALYTSLGFIVREPLSCMQGGTEQRSVPGCTVRTAQSEDVEACNALARHVHGFDRGAALQEAIRTGTAKVVEREGRIVGYASELAFDGHATAETDLDLQALITSVDAFGGPGILVPSRSNSLFRWCVSNGLRVVQPMTLMTIGFYQEPCGAWLPSILF